MESSTLINDTEEKVSYNSILLTIPQYRTYNYQKLLNAFHTFFLIVFVAIATLWIQTSVSLYIPMYSEVAMKKGLSDSEIGVIMGMSPFVSFIIYPFMNIFVNNNNFKLSFAISGFYLSASLVLFGLLTEMERIPFEIFSITFQILQAVAQCILFLASYAIMIRIFPKYRTVTISVTEVFIGLGYMIGPPLGGVLFDTFGFTLMYFGTGALSFILISVSVLILIPYKLDMGTIEDEGKEDYFLGLKLFRHLDLALLTIFILLGAICFNYFVPVIGPFMAQRHQMDPGTVGLIFLSGNAVYVLLAPIMGAVTTKIKFLTPFITIGFLIQAIGTFLVPPSNIFVNILNSTSIRSGNMELISPYVGMALVGFGYILSYLPILTELLNRADFHFKYTSNVTMTVNSIIVSVYYLGEGLGPLVAGLVAQYFTLDVVVVYLSGVLVLFAILALLFMIYDFFSVYRRKYTPIAVN